MNFEKWHGLGNDFLLIEEDAWANREHSVSKIICDRNFGVGADGILIVNREKRSMLVINADGTVPEMCGNGLRCVAAYLADGLSDSLVVDTGAGPHRCQVFADGSVEVEMNAASFEPADIGLGQSTALIDAEVSLEDETLTMTAISMGNPHVVTFAKVSEAERLALGPKLETHSSFERGANIGFAELDGDALNLDVWERGAGWTLACGTGACAAVAAAVRTGRRPIGTTKVRLPGGELFISVDSLEKKIRMRGLAKRVFTGTLTAP